MKKNLLIFGFAFATILALPGQLLAQAETNPVSNYITSIGGFINSTIIPLLMALAFLVFVYGIFLNFFSGTGDDNSEKREKGKQLILWSIVGFVLIASVWVLSISYLMALV